MFSSRLIEMIRQRQQQGAQPKPLQIPPTAGQSVPGAPPQQSPQQMPAQMPMMPWMRSFRGQQDQQGFPPGLMAILQGLRPGNSQGQPMAGNPMGQVQSLRQKPQLFGNMVPQNPEMQQTAAPWAGGFKNRFGFFGRLGR